ncbi:MAG: TonB-dependent receptor domain-containing protein, partial [Candidatus Binatia bacterium]
YRDGPCWADGDGAAGPNPREREEDGACFQDLTGETLHRAPDWNASFGFEYRFPVRIGPARLVTGLNVLYQDDTFLNLDLDPVDFQDAFALVNARFGFRGPDDRWSLMLFGRNLTDEVVFLEAADVPLFEGDHFSRQDLPRTLAAELRVRF